MSRTNLFQTAIVVVLALSVMTHSVRAVPTGAFQTALIAVEVYWALTAGGFGDWPEEDEWHTLYGGADLEMQTKGAYLYFKVNATVLIVFSKWVEVSMLIKYGYVESQCSNYSGQGQGIGGFQTEYMADINDVKATVCVNTTEGEYFFNRREFSLIFPSTSTTTQTTTATMTTTGPATTTTNSSATTSPTGYTLGVVLDPFLMVVASVVLLAIAGPVYALNKRGRVILVVCPYCGAKNEQGLLRCRNCGAGI